MLQNLDHTDWQIFTKIVCNSQSCYCVINFFSSPKTHITSKQNFLWFLFLEIHRSLSLEHHSSGSAYLIALGQHDLPANVAARPIPRIDGRLGFDGLGAWFLLLPCVLSAGLSLSYLHLQTKRLLQKGVGVMGMPPRHLPTFSMEGLASGKNWRWSLP